MAGLSYDAPFQGSRHTPQDLLASDRECACYDDIDVPGVALSNRSRCTKGRSRKRNRTEAAGVLVLARTGPRRPRPARGASTDGYLLAVLALALVLALAALVLAFFRAVLLVFTAFALLLV